MWVCLIALDPYGSSISFLFFFPVIVLGVGETRLMAVHHPSISLRRWGLPLERSAGTGIESWVSQ
jgi:hypothetical protein